MEISTIGLDLAKSVFQVHAVDGTGKAILKKSLRRSQVLSFFSKLSSAAAYRWLPTQLEHRSRFDKALVPSQRFGEQRGRLLAVGLSARPAVVVLKRRPEGRMGAVGNDQLGSLLGAEPSQISETLLRHNDLDVLIDVIDVARVRHDRRNLPSLCGGG
jgi:hypothetical protein